MRPSILGVGMVMGAIFLLPAAAMGQGFSFEMPRSDIDSARDLVVASTLLIGWIFTFLMVIAVFMVFYASFLYLTAGGESEKVNQANHILRYAVIAIAVAVLSRSIPMVVKTFMNDTTAPSPANIQDGTNFGPGSLTPFPAGSSPGTRQPDFIGDTGPLPTLPIPAPRPPDPVNG